jgi:hypothetical protein
MKISKSHQRFSDYLEDPKVLTNPEDYLGPNWRDVINCWLYVDSLSEDEKIRMENRYYALKLDVRVSAWHPAYDAATEIVGWEVRDAAMAAASRDDYFIFDAITIELIGLHKLLEQCRDLTFITLCLNS